MLDPLSLLGLELPSWN